ncbi:hypothetical protein GCM10010483_40910 [Actinokineospora diospyrosa]
MLIDSMFVEVCCRVKSGWPERDTPHPHAGKPKVVEQGAGVPFQATTDAAHLAARRDVSAQQARPGRVPCEANRSPELAGCSPGEPLACEDSYGGSVR